jgi:hypothetical protein
MDKNIISESESQNIGKYCRRIVWRLYKTGWIDNWIYWITHNYSVCTFTAHYSLL